MKTGSQSIGEKNRALMDSGSSMFSDVNWSSDEPRKSTFRLQLSPEQGPKRSLCLYLSPQRDPTQRLRGSCQSLDGTASFTRSKNFQRVELNSSFPELGSESDLRNSSKDLNGSGQLQKANNNSFSKCLADWNAEFILGEAKVTKSAKGKESCDGTPERSHHKSSKHRRSTVSRKPKSDRSSRQSSSKHKRGESKKQLLKANETVLNQSSDYMSPDDSPVKSAMELPKNLVAKNQAKPSRGRGLRRQSTSFAQGESPTKQSRALNRAASRGNIARRRVSRHASMSHLVTTRKRVSGESNKEGDDEVDTTMGVRRTRSFDPKEIFNEQLCPSLQRKESFVEKSKPFDTQGLKRVDSILVNDLWSESSTVVITALCELYSLCIDGDSDVVESLKSSGGASSIVGVARKFHNAVGIQREALRVLAACLKTVDEDFRLLLTRIGGLLMVSSIMENYFDDEAIQELASEVLHAVVSAKSKVPSEVFVAEVGGMPLLLRIVKAHQSNETITENMASAFCSMARFESLRKKLEAGVGTVRKLLDRNKESTAVKARESSPNNITAAGA